MLLDNACMRSGEQRDAMAAPPFDEGFGFSQSAFFKAIYTLINERIKYPTGTYLNLLYKYMANAGIGAMGRGLNMKKVYDPATGSHVPVPAGPLTNPLYAG